MKTRKNIRGVVAIAIIGAIVASGLPTAMGFGYIPPNSPESKYNDCRALVIGISDHPGRGHDDLTKSSTTDATEFYRQLKKSWPISTKINLLKDYAATECAIDHAFEYTFRGAGPKTLAIVYWTGHSGLDENGDRGIMTYDSHVYTPTKLAEKLSNIDAGAIIVIIDGCYIGVYEQELDVEGQVALMSCQADETLGVYKYVNPLPSYHSVFLYYLNRIPKWADKSGNGWISVEEAFAYANDMTVKTATKHGESDHPIMVDNCPGEVDFLRNY